MVAALPHTDRKLTSFHAELDSTEKDIAALEASLAMEPRDIEKRTRLAYRLYHFATLTEQAGAYRAAEKAIATAISQFGPQEDLCLLQANLDFRFHRLAQAARDLRMAPKLPERFEARSLRADLDFQQGRYQEARAEYEALIEEDRTWDNLARLAHFRGKMGDADGADRLYIDAEDELTAKEMRSFAWLELQRGVLDVARGRYEEAHAHYRRADRAYSGYWLVHEHIAEVLAATGHPEEAAALYQQVIAAALKPELLQTLGELYLSMGLAPLAAPWLDRALAAYLESAGRGEVHYYHHLADFFADVREDGASAVKWARKDIALRENFSTQTALAWALYRAGAIEEALVWIEMAMASGAVSAGLFQQAAAIHKAAGNGRESRRLMDRASAINPHHAAFHVHR